jgi:hypothetical protein
LTVSDKISQYLTLTVVASIEAAWRLTFFLFGTEPTQAYLGIRAKIPEEI